MAAPARVDEWTGRDVTVSEIDRELTRLRELSAEHDEMPDLRTSVMTHIAWVPPEWVGAAQKVMAGLAERHPSRTILLMPDPESRRDAIDAEVSLKCFPLGDAHRHVCTEVVELRLLGERAASPASVVMPLLVSDLPVFLRWRGEPPFGEPELEGLVAIVDRLVVDSREWSDLPAAYGRVAGLFDRAAVSDIAWSRTTRWRQELAALWPAILGARTLEVRGPKAEALLLSGWLRARAGLELELKHRRAAETTAIAVDGEPVRAPRRDKVSVSDLLSDELDRYDRDRIYEDAVRAAAT